MVGEKKRRQKKAMWSLFTTEAKYKEEETKERQDRENYIVQ